MLYIHCSTNHDTTPQHFHSLTQPHSTSKKGPISPNNTIHLKHYKMLIAATSDYLVSLVSDVDVISYDRSTRHANSSGTCPSSNFLPLERKMCRKDKNLFFKKKSAHPMFSRLRKPPLLPRKNLCLNNSSFPARPHSIIV